MSTINRLKMRNAWIAIVVACVLNVAGVALTRWAAQADTEALVSELVRTASARVRSDAQLAAMESMTRPMVSNYPVVVIIGTVITLVAMATVFFLVFKMADAGLTWSQVLGALGIAFAAQAAARLVMTAMVAFARPPTVRELANNSYPNFSAAALVSPDSSPVLLAAGRNLDAMTFVLLMVFVGVINDYCGSKASKRAVAITVALTFAAWMFIRVGWAAITG